MFLDQAEFRAQRRKSILMTDWEIFLDKFLDDVELPVLAGPGRASHQEALETANEQYDRFAEKRRQEALQQADQHYIDELKQTAKSLSRKYKEGES